MKLNNKRTVLIGLAFLSICAFWQTYDNIIPLILKNTFHLEPGATGIVMAADNIFALFMIPFFGMLSDKVNTRMGKRTPFIVFGTLVAVVFMMLIPAADQSKNFILFFVALGGVLFAMGTYRSPAVALMPDLTPKPLRSKANAIINLMGTLGGIYALFIMKFLIKKSNEGENPNYFPVFLAIAAIMLIAITLLLVTIREKKLAREILLEDKEPDVNEKANEKEKQPMQKDVKRSMIFIFASIFLWFTAYNAITSAFSRYAQEVWNLQDGSFANCLLVATGAAAISYIPIGALSTKIGRKKTILLGVGLITLSYLSGGVFTSYHWAVNIVFAFTGIAWAAINVNSYPMVVEMSKASDTGKYTGLYYMFSMSAQILTPILSGYLIQFFSYRVLFPYAVFFSVLSFITMLFVMHGDAKPIKKDSVLEHFDVED